jgi:methyl-accepting chemotaxis protein
LLLKQLQKWFAKASKSIITKATLSMFLIIIFLCSTFVTMNYIREKKQYLSELEIIHVTANAVMRTHIPLIDSLQNGSEAEKKEAMAELQKQFDGLKQNKVITASHVSRPAIAEKDGAQMITLLASDTGSNDVGFGPGHEYVSGLSKAQFESMTPDTPMHSDVVVDEYGEWMSFFSPLVNEQGEISAYLGTDYEYSSVRHELNKSLITNVATAAVIGAIVILFIFLAIRNMIRPIKEMAALSLRAAQGDLTTRISTTRRDETGQLAQNFNTMVENLKNLILQMKETSDEVTITSQALSAGSDQSTQVMQEIAFSTSEMAQGAESQMQVVQESSRAMGEIASGVQNIAEASVSAAQQSSTITTRADEGYHALQKMELQMDQIRHTVLETVQVVQELSHRSSQVDSISGIIGELANQTNLLALNASIEAARAGESGRGFAVVATEVRKLAEQSRESSKQISQLIGSIQEETRRAVASMDKGSKEVELGSNVVRQTVGIFNVIIEAIRELTLKIEASATTSEDISAGTQEVSAAIEQSASVAVISSKNTQNIVAATQEQCAMMDEIAQAAARLNRLAVELQQRMNQFQL